MKKIINTIQNKITTIATRSKTALTNTRGEGYVDTGVKILIAVVIGARSCKIYCVNSQSMVQ